MKPGRTEWRGAYSAYCRGIIVGVSQGHVHVGVIRRSGPLKALGHFCHVQVSVNGRKRWAGGAEDRIFPFHSVELDKGEAWPELELRAVGWCKDGNTFAYMDRDGKLVTIYGDAVDAADLKPIPPERPWYSEDYD